MERSTELVGKDSGFKTIVGVGVGVDEVILTKFHMLFFCDAPNLFSFPTSS